MAVTADPKDAGTIYIGTHEAGVFKSTDSGVTWKQMNNGLGGMDVHGLASVKVACSGQGERRGNLQEH
jgi:hypothetical protein